MGFQCFTLSLIHVQNHNFKLLSNKSLSTNTFRVEQELKSFDNAYSNEVHTKNATVSATASRTTDIRETNFDQHNRKYRKRAQTGPPPARSAFVALKLAMSVKDQKV